MDRCCWMDLCFAPLGFIFFGLCFYCFLSCHFFIGKQQKLEGSIPPKVVECMLFNMFKGATNPRHDYVPRFKNVCLWEMKCVFMGNEMCVYGK